MTYQRSDSQISQSSVTMWIVGTSVVLFNVPIARSIAYIVVSVDFLYEGHAQYVRNVCMVDMSATLMHGFKLTTFARPDAVANVSPPNK